MSKDPSTPRIGWISSNSTPRSSSKWAKLQDRFHGGYKPRSASTNSSPVNRPLEQRIISQPTCSASLDFNVSTNPSEPLYSARTTSIPRNVATPSTSSSTTRSDTRLPSGVSSTPPKIQPFLYSKSNTPPKVQRKTLINLKCCFCEELMSSRLSSEKIIELSCGDVCHEQCLSLLLDFDDSKNKYNDPYAIFPFCESCNKQAIPVDETVTDEIVSRFLILRPQSQSDYNSNTTQSDAFIISPNYQLPLYTKTQSMLDSPLMSSMASLPSSPSLHGNSSHARHDSQQSQKHQFQGMSFSNKNAKDLSIHIPDRPYSRSHSHRRSKSRASRGSSISAISSIVSSVPKSPSPTMSQFGDNQNSHLDGSRVPLALSRSGYVSNLLQNLRANRDESIKESDFDSYGLLRLVDKLKISETGENFNELIAYLFQYNIILVDTTYSHLVTYHIPDTPKVKTPNSSTLKVSFGKKSLYMTHRSNKVLQKWIAGLCDYDFVFGSEDLSSTLRLDGSEIKDSDSSESFDFPPSIGTQSIEEEGNDNSGDQVTLSVGLSPMKLQEDDATPVVASAPNVTAFEKKEKSIFLIDHTQLVSTESLMTLKNIAKVLNMKLNDFKMVYSHDFSEVVKFGGAEMIDFIGSQASNNSSLSISATIESLAGAAKDDWSLVILTNSTISSTILSQLPISNQLVVLVENYNASTFSDVQGENVIKLGSWEKIMEVLISRLRIEFSAVEDDDDTLDSDSFDSDAFDSDYDSAEADENGNNDTKSINSILGTGPLSHDTKSINSIVVTGNLSRDDPKLINSDDIKGEEFSDNNDDNMSLQEVQFDSLEKGDGVDLSPISSDDHIIKDERLQDKDTSRWTALFNDIDAALIETNKLSLSDSN